MWSYPPTAKQLSNLKLLNDDTKIEIPERWEDFARTTDIKSQGKVVRFTPYDYQIELVKILEKYTTICVKSRQLGVSECVVNLMSYRALKSKGYMGLVFSKIGKDSSLLADRSKMALKSFGCKLDKDNESHIMIRGGGDIRFLNSSENSSRGSASVSDSLYDESAFNENLKGIREATQPAMSMLGADAREWFMSTPDTPSGYFYDLANSGNNEAIEETCQKVTEGIYPPFFWYLDQNGIAKVFISWRVHPIYGNNPNFLIDLKTKKQLDEATIQREYNLSFSNPANEYFTREELKRCHKENLKLKQGVPGEKYIGALDPNNAGKDRTVFSIWRVKNGTFTKIYDYSQSGHTMEYHLEKIKALILRFSNMVIIVESNAHGKNWFTQIFDGYPSKTVYECHITANNKEAYIHRLKHHIESQKLFFEPTDPFNIDALNFRQTEVPNIVTGSISYRYAAIQGGFDDQIMAGALMLEAASRKGWIANTLCD